MNIATHSQTYSSSRSPGGTAAGNVARAFSGHHPMVVDLQAQVRVREGKQRAHIVPSGVPSSRVRQLLASVLALKPFEYVTPEILRVDIHRPDTGRYRHDYGLALSVAIVSSLSRRPLADDLLFVGDLDLQGRLCDIAAKRVDQINDAVAAFQIETPLKIVCAPQTATWINASSTVAVIPAVTLENVVAAVWPGVVLQPR